MSPKDIIRAWRDDEFRSNLSEQQREQLPAHPAGLIELSDDELESVTGAVRQPRTSITANNCQTPELTTALYEHLRSLLGGK